MMETAKEPTPASSSTARTPIDWYLTLGALSNVNQKYFHGKIPTWNDFVEHPNYDEFWKKQSSAPHLGDVESADAERRRLVRPGGFLRPAEDLRTAREARQEASELPGRRPLESRRLGARRRRQARRDHVRQRHRQVLPRRHRRPVVRLLPEGQGRRATSPKP